MNLLNRSAERLRLSRIYARMARRFGSGDLTLGTLGQLNDDGKVLERQYRAHTVAARRSAILLRRIAHKQTDKLSLRISQIDAREICTVQSLKLVQ